MRTGITTITSAYDEKKKNRKGTNTVSSSTLDSMYESLNVSEWNDTSSWENYKKVAGDSTASLTDLKNAQDELATSYVNSNNFLSNLTEENSAYYEGLLKEMGVVNATSVVTESLRKNRADLAVETYSALDKESKNDEEFNKLKDNLIQCTKKEKEYYFAKLLANGENIDTKPEREQLLNLADKLGINCNLVKALSGELNNFDGTTAKATVKVEYDTSSGTSNDINGYNANTQSKKSGSMGNTTNTYFAKGAVNANKQSKKSGSMGNLTNTYFAKGAVSTKKKSKTQIFAEQELKELRNRIKTDVKISKENTNNGKKEDTNKAKELKQEINWLERRLTRMQSIIDLTASKSQNLFSVKSKNKNLDKQIKQSTTLMKQYSITADTYMKKANKIAKASGKGKNKVPALSKDIINKIKSGKITKASYSKLIKKYGQSYADKINSSINYYDKAQDARKNKEDQIAKIRLLEEEKLQNQVNDYNAKATLAETNAGNAVGYQTKNSYIKTQLSYLEKSYKKQIDIAKLTDDTTEQERLQVELEAKKVELKQQQIDNLKKEYENKIGVIDNGKQNMDNQVSKVEARGQIVQSSYYSSLNQYENQKLSTLNDELAKLQAQQNTFAKNSQEWYNLQSDIQSTKNAINDAEIAIIENNKKIGELRQAMYDDIASRNSDVSTEANFLAGLLGDNLTNEKTGDLTKEGLAVLGTYGIGMESNASTALSYKKDREEIEKAIASYKKGNAHALDSYGSLEAAEKKLAEVIQKQQDAISAEYANEKQIYDLMTQKYETQLSYLKSIIDAKKQVLDMEKDLYDYQKNIASQTKNIATLEKQLAALQGDDSEEGRARKAKIQFQLDEANEELQDTEYERYISDQQNMLDNLYSQYEDLIQELGNNFETVVQEGIELINSKSDDISTTLKSYAQNYGYNPSTDMNMILNELSTIDDNAIKTLPDTITTGLSNLGTIFQTSAQSIIDAYHGVIPNDDNTDLTNVSNNGYTSERAEAEAKTAEASAKYYEDKKRVEKSLTGTTQKLPSGYADVIVSGIKAGKANTTPKPETTKERNKKIQTAVSYIQSHLSTAKKKKSEYSDINKAFYTKWNKKVLNDSELKTLAGKVGVSYDNATKNGKLYKRLKELGISGFKHGGIGQLVKTSGEDGIALVRNGEGFIAPEHVEAVKNLMNIVPDITHFTNALTNIKPIKRDMGNTYGDIVINAELPNVENVQDFVHALQNDKKTQQALTIATKDLMEKGRITNHIQNIR